MAKSYKEILKGVKPREERKKRTYQEILQNNDYDFGVDKDYIDSFLKDSEDYLKSAVSDSEGVNFNNSSAHYSNKQARWSSLNDRAMAIRAFYNSNKDKLDEDTYNSMMEYIDGFDKNSRSALSYYKKNADYYSKWETEDDYNKSMEGWLVDDAETNAETSSKRMARYKSNSARLAEIEKEIKAEEDKRANTTGAMVEYTNEFTIEDPNYQGPGTYSNSYKASVGEVDDAKIKSLRAEKEKLLAENNTYERTQYTTDKYFVPQTAEFLQNGAFRDYNNASKDELWNYDVSVSEGSEALNNGGYFDEEGNIRNSKGEIVQSANAPVVEDKLGLFLSLSDEEIAEGYNRLSATNGNYTDTWANLVQEGDVNGWKYLEPNETNIYYDLYKREGQEAAYKFLEDMAPTLTRRETEATEEYINNASALGKLALNIASVPMNVLGGVTGLVDNVSNLVQGKEINPYSRAHAFSNATDAIRETTANDIDNLTGNVALPWVGTTFGDVYQSIMSFGDSALASAIPGGHLLLAGGAAERQMKDLYDRGATTGQMVTGGLLAGVAEAVFEKWSIGELKSIKNMSEGAVKNKLGIFVKGLLMGGVEASEEMATEIVNQIVDAVIMGSQSNWEDFNTFAKNVVNAGIGGFISGGLGGNIAATANYNEYNNKVVKPRGELIKNAGQVGKLTEVAKALDKTKAAKYADNITKKSSAYAIGKLYGLTEAELSKSNQADIVKSLERKGIDTNSAKEIANIMLSEKGESTYGADVETNEGKTYNDLINNPESTVNKREEGLKNILRGVAEHNLINEIKKATKEAEKSEAIANAKEVERSIEEGNKVSAEEGVSVKKIDSFKDGKMMVATDDGNVSDSNDVQFKTEDEAYIVLSTANLSNELNALGIDFDVESANKVMHGFDANSGVSATTYMLGAREAIRYGVIGQNSSALTEGGLFNDLTKSQQKYLYNIGRKIAERTTKADEDKRKASMPKETAKADAKSTQTTSKNGKVTKPNVKLTETQSLAVEMTENLSKEGILKNNIHFFTSKRGTIIKDGKRVNARVFTEDVGIYKKGQYAPNGFYQDANGDVYIDLNSGVDGQGLSLYTLAHELGHFVKRQNPSGYKVLADFISNELGDTLEDLIKAKLDVWKRLGRKNLNYMDAYEDVICDALEPMFTDGHLAEKLVNYAKTTKEGRGLIKTLLDFFRDLAERIKKAYAKLSPDDPAAVEMLKRQKALEKASDLFAKALVGAESNFANADVKAQKNTTDEGDVKFALREYSQHQKDNWKNSKRIVIYESETQFRDFINEALQNKQFDKKLYFGAIPTDLAALIKSKTGLDVEGFNCSLSAYEIRKLFDDHGDETKEALRGQRAITEDDIVNIPLVLQSPETIVRSKKDYMGKPVINMTKHINGKMTIAAVVSDKHLDLFVQTAYVGIKKGNLVTPIAEQAAINTPKASSDTVSNNSISNPKKNVKGNTVKNSDRINQSMTMEQAKTMVQKSFVAAGIKDWYDDKYKNGDEWLKGEGVDEVAMYIENEYTLQEKYLNKIQAYLDGDIALEEILQAYLNGTLVGQEKPKANRLDTSVNYRINDSRFYSPKRIENVKELFEIAGQKLTSKNKAEVSSARAKILLFAHNEGASELLGLTKAELNQKLRSWSGYTSSAREISQRINKGVADSNKWTGIENCSWLVKGQVTAEELESLVKEIIGSSSQHERNYIARTMLALDTHIDWTELTFDFKRGYADERRKSVLGLYDNSKRTVTIGGSSGMNTVAHEMGHALDYKWQRDLFGEGKDNNPLSENFYKADLIQDEEGKRFYKNFRIFIDSLTDVNVNYSSYTMEAKETFARFVARFVEWVETTAGGRNFREGDYYGDKFTGAQYIEFVKLLQEKAMLDAKRMASNTNPTSDPDIRFSDRDYSYDALTSKPDMTATLVNDKVVYKPSSTIRKNIVNQAIKNATSIGKTNENGNVVIRVDDIETDVVVSKSSLAHGLDRRLQVSAPVILNIGSVLKNSVRINELVPKAKTANKSYVLIGYAESADNSYIVRMVVNNYTNEMDSVDVLYAVNTKKETVGIKPGSHGKTTLPTVSAISISNLLEYVNRFFPDVLSEDVLRYFGHTARPEGDLGESVLYSDRSYAPTFYSYMGKIVDDIRIEKMGAGGVVPYLKGKGVKNEEIKWSGIEAFLEGKKSVTKAELQEFVSGSMLQIGEQMSDGLGFEIFSDDGDNYKVRNKTDGTIVDEWEWSEDVEDGLEGWMSKYGDIAITVDEIEESVYQDWSSTRWSDYKLNGGSNYRELVFTMPNSSYSNSAMRTHWGEDAEGVLAHARIQDFVVNGKRILFIEEIQSDWHNEGHKLGYAKELSQAEIKRVTELQKTQGTLIEQMREKHQVGDTEGARKLFEQEKALYQEVQKIQGNKNGAPDAPFSSNYYEYVLKRLIRMAAEEGYDSIGWTPSEIQRERWSDKFAEAYRIEYDQEIPKFLNKYGKKWGTKVGSTMLSNGTEVWSMDITDSMKNSVLYEGQALFSDRDIGLDTRTLLANALESTAQNPTEKDWLGRYKAQIASLNADQERLNKINAEIKEISFTKGKDRTKLPALKNNKKTLEDRILRTDKQLLKIEASKVLKNVLEKEKALVWEKARAKAREERKIERETAAQTLRDTMNMYTERIKTRREGRNKTEMRHKIKKVVGDLRSLLNRGTKERNVKIGLQDTVGKALATAEILFSEEISNADIVRLGVDSVTPNEQKYLTEYATLLDMLDEKTLNAGENVEIARIRSRISRLNSLLKDVFIRERARLNRENVSNAMNSLAEAYMELRKSEDAYIKENAFVQGMYERIVNLAEDLKGVTIKDMNLQQLTDIYKMYSMVKHMVTKANSIFREGRYEDLSQLISLVQGEIDSIKSSDKDKLKAIAKAEDFVNSFTWNELKPLYAFERLGSDTFKKLFWDIIEADNVWAKDIEEAGKVIEDARKKYGYKKWDTKAVKTFKSANGLEFKLTLADMMSIYAYSKRPQAEDHMTIGGFAFDENNVYKEKKKGINLTYKHAKLSETYKVDITLINQIMKELSKIEGVTEYVDEVQGYLTKLGEKGNEVSRELFGIDLFKEKAYFPLKSATDYRSSIEQALNATPTMASLKNTGIAKETLPHADNPIVLQGFDDIVLDHINTMSKYHAYVIPIENISKVFNNVGKDVINGDYTATKALIKSKFGESAKKYFEQFITDLNGGAFGGGAENPLAKFFGTAKAVSVSANLSVVVQQYFAVVRAMDEINPKYFTPFLNGEGSKSEQKQWDELKKYAPIAIIKEIGGVDMGLNRSAIEYMGDAETKMDAERVGKKVKEGSMWLAGKMDEIGWSTIWRAVKKEIADTTKLAPGTEEFFQACSKRFTEIIVKTQVYDSISSRSGYMRSKHESVKYLTSFMGEPTTIVNMMFSKQLAFVRAIKAKDSKAIKEASKKLARTSGVIILSTVLTSLAKSLPYAMRDDEEEDEALMERWTKHFGESLASDMNPLNMIPIGRDLVSIWEGWDVERPDMTLIADVFDTVKKAIDEGCTWEEAMNLSGSMANILGYPLKNVIRDGKGIIRLFGDIFDDNSPNDVGGAFSQGFSGKSDKEFLLDRFTRTGDRTFVKNEVADMLKQKTNSGKTQKEARTAVRQSFIGRYREEYIKGNAKERNNIRKLLYATGLWDSLSELDELLAKWIKDSK